MSTTLERARHDIAEHGWHVIKVAGDSQGPAFAYSIGFGVSRDHPEVVAFGLPLDTLHTIINLIGEAIRSGARLEANTELHDICEGVPLALRPVAAESLPEYLGQALAYYEADGLALSAVQAFWPDAKGRYPWEDGVDDACKSAQPILGSRA